MVVNFVLRYLSLNSHLFGLLFEVQYLDRMVFLGLGESGVCVKGISDFRNYGGWLVFICVFFDRFVHEIEVIVVNEIDFTRHSQALIRQLS